MIIALCVLNALTLLAVCGLAWLMFNRRLAKTELAIILDAMDLTRDHVDTHATHTHEEHKALTKILNTIGGRVQFLMAVSIAEELAAEKESQRIKVEQPLDMPL